MSVILLSSCAGPHGHFDACPFGVMLGTTSDVFLKAVDSGNNVKGWEQSETYRMRDEKRTGISNELLDRIPEFGSLFFDLCMDDSLKFVTSVSHNIPIPALVPVFCSATLDRGRVSSLCCIHFLEDFDDVSSIVRKYVDMFDARYGHYERLTAILDSEGRDYSSLDIFKEGAFLWKKGGRRVELFVNRYQILRDIGFRDLGPMCRYELVLRYK